MKKSAASVLILMLVLLAAFFSQEAQAAVGFGIKAGMNSANITGPEVEKEWKNRMNLVAGGFFTLRLNNLFAVQPEILYSKKGPKWDGLFDGEDFKATVNIDYLDLVALVKLFIPVSQNSVIRPNVYAGPYAGLKLKGKLKYELAGVSGEDELEHLKSTDIGLVFGGGVDFSAGTGKLLVDFRFGMSLSSISKEEDDKNRVFSVLIGYSF